jgi:hypothetical protein
MRKVFYAAAGAAALAMASVANAAITVNGSTNLDTPITAVNTATKSTVDFGLNPVPAGNFTSTIDFANSIVADYTINFATSTRNLLLNSILLAGTGTTTGWFSTTTGTTGPGSISVVGVGLAAGTYRVTLNGTAPAGGGVFTGSITATPTAVPEPGTWALMLLGFGGIGFALRRTRRPTLAQLA